MFNNIGNKIKVLAKVLCWIGIALSIIVGMFMFYIASRNTYYGYRVSYIITGILWIVLGTLVSWIASFVLYGFGQLVDNSDKIKKSVSKDECTNKCECESVPEIEAIPEIENEAIPEIENNAENEGENTEDTDI